MAFSKKTLHGSAKLLLDIVSGTTNIVEEMHKTIAKRSSPLSSLYKDIDKDQAWAEGSTYQKMYSVMSMIYKGLDVAQEGLAPETLKTESSGSIKVLAALNGVFGDHLVESNNSLAISMDFNSGSGKLNLDAQSLSNTIPDASPDIAILVHGLCLSHEYWLSGYESCLGNELQDACAHSPIYLDYNTGLHISTNGQDFSLLLDELIEAWPVDVKSISLIGHSMGGLVIRSASWYAEQNNASWLSKLKHCVYLGSPHHGSVVAKAGHLATAAMRTSEYVKPFAFGQHISFGIKDLRHGNLIDEDWQGVEQDDMLLDQRKIIPLTLNCEHYFIAASFGEDTLDIRSMIVGDLLVRLGSAVGHHQDDLRKLNINPENCHIFHGLNHFELLDNQVVHEQVLKWLS
jgi:pimeloyl-ACP methyl ester carboxylesterase